MTRIFEQTESQVRSYCRSFPVVFERARGAELFDRDGKRYLDFLSGAGSLNYGHNEPRIQAALQAYIAADGITHGLDMYTRAKQDFLEALRAHILEPRGLDYRVQFTGPTGTNAVEAALKIARRVTGRHNVVAFTNGFHGVSLGSMAATGNSHHRDAAGLPLIGVTHLPYDGYMGADVDTTRLLAKMIEDKSSGLDTPAAVLVETVQGEGGLNVARTRWLQSLAQICRKHGILLIIDDIQAGCGRTGSFFSFEPAGLKPDIVTLSKSLSGFGLPLAVVLLDPELDTWRPGEHNGTFRGNNHAFVTARAALEHYWQDNRFADEINDKATLLRARLKEICSRHGDAVMQVRGRGMMQGINCRSGQLAEQISRRAFERGLVIETSGAESQVVKCLAPLTIPVAQLEEGLDILARIAAEVLSIPVSKAS